MKLDIRSLSHHYRGGRSAAIAALEQINLEINPGEFAVLIGPSGCGKSTLLRILAGLIVPTKGLVRLDGASPAQAAAGKRIAWMAQKPALLPWRNVQDNIALAQQINPQNGRTTLPPRQLLKLVGLEEFGKAYPFTLSGGMQQRAALARTLATSAGLWLMDEPFSALDDLTRERLTGQLLELWREFRPTVLWVTHSIHEAVRLADRVFVMSPRPGRIKLAHPIDIPRPRDDTRQEFQLHVRQLRQTLEFNE